MLQEMTAVPRKKRRPGRPRKRAADLRRFYIMVPATESEMEQARRAAADRGTTVAAMMRDLLRAALNA